MNALSQISSFRVCAAPKAVDHFLGAMRRCAEATYPVWRAVLKGALEDAHLGYETRRAVFEIQPTEDYYFAGIVGLDAAKIRALYPAPEATDLLAMIGEKVDAVAQRTDRVVSGLVFDAVGRIGLLRSDQHRLPHDEVVRLILEQMGWQTVPETRALLWDVFFRHQLSEPLACGVPLWWSGFHAKFTLSPGAMLSAPLPPAPLTQSTKPRTARRLI